MGWLLSVVSCGPRDREFPRDVDAVRDADPPASCDSPTLEETRRAVNQLKCGKAPEGCGIYAEMHRTGKRPPFCGCTFCCVPFGTRGSSTCSIWNTKIIPTDWRRGLVVPNRKVNSDTQGATTTGALPFSLCQARSWHEFFSTGSEKTYQLTSAMSSLVSHRRSLP